MQDVYTEISNELGNLNNVIKTLVNNPDYDLNGTFDENVINSLVIDYTLKNVNTSGVEAQKEEEESNILNYVSVSNQSIFDVSINTYFDLNNIIPLCVASDFTINENELNNKSFIVDKTKIVNVPVYNYISNKGITFATNKGKAKSFYLLQENSFYLLQENGFKIIL